MKTFGKWTVIYAGTCITVSAVTVAWVAIFPSDEQWTIHLGYYEATAQILPVLMLAVIVRAASVGRGIHISHRGMQQDRAEMLSAITDSRAAIEKAQSEIPEDADPSVLARVVKLESEVKSKDVGSKAAQRLIELVGGVFISTLVLGAGGILASLMALARASDSGAIASATFLALVWMIVGLATMEVGNLYLGDMWWNEAGS